MRAILFLGLSAFLLPFAAAETVREAHATYTIGSPASWCPLLAPQMQGFGNACFPLEGNEPFYRLVVTDASGLTPATADAFYDAEGLLLGGGYQCGGTEDAWTWRARVPAGAVRYVVWVMDPATARAFTGCFVSIPPTTGTIDVTWMTTIHG